MFDGYTSTSMKNLGNENYNRLSYAIQNHIRLTKIWNIDNCVKVIEKLQAHVNEKDDFNLILICLKAVFPHLGARQLNIMEEIQNFEVMCELK